MRRPFAPIALLATLAILSGCASTSVEFSGNTPTSRMCDGPNVAGNALVLWGTQWRSDQKDVPLREAAAEQGLREYFAQPVCFSKVELRRTPASAPLATEQLKQLASAADPKIQRLFVITIRELGPVVKLLSSAALVEGGTEVVLHVSFYALNDSTRQADFTVHWQNGGAGVIKGVSTLPQDMRAALAVAFEQSASRK
jgi:hypothetical protein